MANDKISEFVEKTTFDSTTIIPIVQGNPLDNYRITPDNLAINISGKISQILDINGINNSISGKTLSSLGGEPTINKKTILNPLSEIEFPNSKAVADFTNADIFNELYPAVPYIKRVRTDGGIIESKSDLTRFFEMNEPFKDNILLSYVPFVTGNKIRTVSATEKYITKGYSSVGTNDLTQTTALNQPFLDKVAPIEKLSVKAIKGNEFLNYSDIVFSATDKWTLEICFNNFGSVTTSLFLGNKLSNSGFDCIYTSVGNVQRWAFYNSSSQNTKIFGIDNYFDKHIGKNTRFTLVANGDGILHQYIDDKLIYSSPIVTSFKTNILGVGYSNLATGLNGSINSYHIFNKALSQPEIAQRAAILTQLFPEIPSVKIGTQTWQVRNHEAIVTPMGNVIQETQAASAVEIVTGGNTFGANWNAGRFTISDGKLNMNVTNWGADAFQWVPAFSGLQRVEVDIVDFVRGGTLTVYGNADATTMYINITGNGKYIRYVKFGLNSTKVLINSASIECKLSFISVKSIGWADSTEIYNAVYAQTSGTNAEKEYTACKEAAMWCYYNNDPIIGATYGKLYNWYAVKLMQLDIDKYNAANPTDKWGWHVPINLEIETLRNYVGGNSFGKSLKSSGSTFWNINNNGTNTTGFSAIGSGVRSNTGGFSYTTTYFFMSAINERLWIDSTNGILVQNALDKLSGLSIRLIKGDL